VNLINLFTSGQIDKTSTINSNGGKGHTLIEMKKNGINVPTGLVIPTDICNQYRKAESTGKTLILDQVIDAVMEALDTHIYPDANHKLVSVRSGAPISMPGMMDTILNVGAGYEDSGLEKNLKADCRRRFVEMYAGVVMEHKGKIDDPVKWMKTIKKHIPELRDIIRNSIEAVWNSFDNERCTHYRKMNKIPNDMGTAVIIQSMVFGNFNDNSGSGVMFTRDPNTGAKKIFGDFLTNCQGEDVVAGAITAPPISEMKTWNIDLYNELVEIGEGLEKKNKDLQEIEFTVEDGVLSILQTRNPLRSSYAEIRIALDLLDEGIIEELGDRITEGTFMKLRVPVLPADFKKKATAKGIGSGYFATGKAAYSVKEVMDSVEATILVAEETTPDDIKAMEKAEGILTYKGSATCHAAVVARGMNKPCVVGCPDAEAALSGDAPSYVLIDGQTGKVYISTKPFELDFSTNIPVELLGSLFEVAITQEDWILVENYEEALSLEDYIYKIGVPTKDLTSNELADLADRFDKVVLINPERRDKVSNFLGTPNPEGMETARELDETICNNPEMTNVFFDSGKWVTEQVAKAYKTMADVMNPDFIGYIEKDFIDNVMGDAETFEKISAQLGLSSRVVAMESALGLLEKRIHIG